MLSIIPNEQVSKYYNARREILESGNAIIKYNYMVELINLQTKNQSPDLKSFPDKLIWLYCISPKLKILITSLVVISCVIPAVSALSVLVLLFELFLVAYRAYIISANNKLCVSPSGVLCEYDELCIDSEGNRIPAQQFSIDFNQFNNENFQNVNALKEMVGVGTDIQTIFFTACRKETGTWMKDAASNQSTEVCAIIFALVIGIILMAVIDGAVFK